MNPNAAVIVRPILLIWYNGFLEKNAFIIWSFHISKIWIQNLILGHAVYQNNFIIVPFYNDNLCDWTFQRWRLYLHLTCLSRQNPWCNPIWSSMVIWYSSIGLGLPGLPAAKYVKENSTESSNISLSNNKMAKQC